MMDGDLGGLDGPVRALFERIAGPAAADPPDLATIGAAMVDLARDEDAVRSWIQRMGAGAGSAPIHAPVRGPRLSLVHRPEGQLSALHDHGTWVAISPISGVETHRCFRGDPDDSRALPQLGDVQALGPADLVTMLPPDDIHDHGHVAGRGQPAYVLILTGDDQRRFVRNEWDLATGRHRLLQPGDSGRWLATEPMPEA